MKTRTLLAVAIALVLSVATAYAQNITFNTGNLWRVTDYRAHCAFPECAPQRSPDVTFNVTGPGIRLNFDNSYPGSSLKVIDWLTHSPNRAVNIVGLPDILNSDMSVWHEYGSIIVFTGSVTVRNGEMFTISHDDYVYLQIGGTDTMLAFSAGVDQVTYNGPDGTFPYQLTYTECCGVDARLIVTHN